MKFSIAFFAVAGNGAKCTGLQSPRSAAHRRRSVGGQRGRVCFPQPGPSQYHYPDCHLRAVATAAGRPELLLFWGKHPLRNPRGQRRHQARRRAHLPRGIQNGERRPHHVFQHPPRQAQPENDLHPVPFRQRRATFRNHRFQRRCAADQHRRAQHRIRRWFGQNL